MLLLVGAKLSQAVLSDSRDSELVKVEKLATIGQMVITINHEINNPLSIISTSTQTLLMLNEGFDEKTQAKLMWIED